MDNIRALVRSSGRCDAEEFLNSLDRRYRTRYLRYLQYLSEDIPIKSPENSRVLRRNDHHDILIAEVEVDKYRLYVIRYDLVWYMSHGRSKPKDHQVPREIDKALNFYTQIRGV